MLSFCLALFVIFIIFYICLLIVCVSVSTHFHSPSNLGALGAELRSLGSEVSGFTAQSLHYPQLSG